MYRYAGAHRAVVVERHDEAGGDVDDLGVGIAVEVGDRREAVEQHVVVLDASPTPRVSTPFSSR